MTLSDQYRAYQQTMLSGDDDKRRSNLLAAIRWLKHEYRNRLLLYDTEAVALAKKLLSRALNAEFTKSEVEAFLGK